MLYNAALVEAKAREYAGLIAVDIGASQEILVEISMNPHASIKILWILFLKSSKPPWNLAELALFQPALGGSTQIPAAVVLLLRFPPQVGPRLIEKGRIAQLCRRHFLHRCSSTLTLNLRMERTVGCIDVSLDVTPWYRIILVPHLCIIQCKFNGSICLVLNKCSLVRKFPLSTTYFPQLSGAAKSKHHVS